MIPYIYDPNTAHIALTSNIFHMQSSYIRAELSPIILFNIIISTKQFPLAVSLRQEKKTDHSHEPTIFFSLNKHEITIGSSQIYVYISIFEYGYKFNKDTYSLLLSNRYTYMKHYKYILCTIWC